MQNNNSNPIKTWAEQGQGILMFPSKQPYSSSFDHPITRTFISMPCSILTMDGQPNLIHVTNFSFNHLKVGTQVTENLFTSASLETVYVW
jgi:hypothetical protein